MHTRVLRQILRGDPFASFVRNRMQASSRRPSAISPNMEQALWLREQFDKGAIPRDPDLISALAEQV
ncbi:MAG: hypothetical protein SGPRY_012373 [Prymnesium sp.]